MKLKFYWWLFIAVLIVSTIVIDIDHFVIQDLTITNFECVWHGFLGHTEEFNICSGEEINHNRIFHHPYFWAIFIGLTIGGIFRKWDMGYNT